MWIAWENNLFGIYLKQKKDAICHAIRNKSLLTSMHFSIFWILMKYLIALLLVHY